MIPGIKGRMIRNPLSLRNSFKLLERKVLSVKYPDRTKNRGIRNRCTHSPNTSNATDLSSFLRGYMITAAYTIAT